MATRIFDNGVLVQEWDAAAGVVRWLGPNGWVERPLRDGESEPKSAPVTSPEVPDDAA